jgi:LysR family transcriptional regulator for bpeEF and oprC
MRRPTRHGAAAHRRRHLGGQAAHPGPPASFCDRYPDIQLDLGVSDRTVDLISDNVDCVIRGGELNDQSLVARRIGTLPFVTVASPAYMRRYGMPQHPQRHREAPPVVSYFSGTTRRVYPHEFNKGDELIELDGHYRVSVNESNAHITAVLGGWASRRCITFMAEPLLESGELVEVLPDWERDPLPITWCTRPTGT